MWEALGSSIKTFLEKDLIPFIASLAAGILSVLLIPEGNWMIQKLGSVWIGILAFSLCFLLIKLLMFLSKGIKKRVQKSANIRYEKEREEETKIEMITKLWGAVDQLSPGDRQTLKMFLESGNKPVEEPKEVFYEFGSLFHTDWIVSTVVPLPVEEQDGNTVLNGNGIPIAHFLNQGKRLYKLKDDIYQLLKYSKETYGKISNFE